MRFDQRVHKVVMLGPLRFGGLKLRSLDTPMCTTLTAAHVHRRMQTKRIRSSWIQICAWTVFKENELWNYDFTGIGSQKILNRCFSIWHRGLFVWEFTCCLLGLNRWGQGLQEENWMGLREDTGFGFEVWDWTVQNVGSFVPILF